jgi:Ca2+-binding RTX toxin-like protein
VGSATVGGALTQDLNATGIELATINNAQLSSDITARSFGVTGANLTTLTVNSPSLTPVTITGGGVLLTTINASNVGGAVTNNANTATAGFSLTTGGGNDVLTGGAAADTFNVTAGTDAITDLSVGGTADLLVVSSGAVANAKVGGAFTASASTVNNGTANITTETFAVDMTSATGSKGFTLIQAAKVLSNKVLVTNAALATITGSAAADTIYGAGAADSLVGGGGNDAIFGDAGADTITGGLGQDSMTGGAGADTFIFAAGDSSVTAPDVIVGYTVLTDKLDLTSPTVAANVTLTSPNTYSLTNGLVKDTATGPNGSFTSVAAGRSIPADG